MDWAGKKKVFVCVGINFGNYIRNYKNKIIVALDGTTQKKNKEKQCIYLIKIYQLYLLKCKIEIQCYHLQVIFTSLVIKIKLLTYKIQ